MEVEFTADEQVLLHILIPNINRRKLKIVAQTDILKNI